MERNFTTEEVEMSEERNPITQEEIAVVDACLTSVIHSMFQLADEHPDILFTMVRDFKDRMPRPAEVPGSTGWSHATLNKLSQYWPELIQQKAPDAPEE